MTCNTCKKVDPVDPLKHGLEYSFAVQQSTVIGKDGRSYSLIGPLIPRPYRPRGGWQAEIYIHGHKLPIKGLSAVEVFNESARLLTLNEVLYSKAQLWLNLNIQWVTRAIPKYQKVSLDTLLEISVPNY